MIDLSRSAPVAAGVHHVDALQPGARLAEFEVLELLGVGGFGMVYKAFDHSLLRFVAIKEYMPTALAGRLEGSSLSVRSSSDEQTFQAGLASFVDEARLLAQFDHPSLVKVFRFWEENQTAYMVMPLYTGMTFKQARAHMPAPPSEAWLRKVLWSVAGALRTLHDGHTLHRDISPDNIFLQDAGPPVLLDLGAARRAINDKDRKFTAVLKVNYAPIEQYTDPDSDLPQGPWSDLYSLGAVVHGCLCNDTPLPATLRAIRDRMVPFARVARTVRRQFGVEYSEPFVEAIGQALALQPQDRLQTVEQFLRTMDMATAPEGLEQFDFRAELGTNWAEPSGHDSVGVAVPVIDLTSIPAPAPGTPIPPPPLPTTGPRAPSAAAYEATVVAMGDGGETVSSDRMDAVVLDAPDTVFEPYDAPPASRGHRRRRARTPVPLVVEAAVVPFWRRWPTWVAAGCLAVGAIGAGAWWLQPQRAYTPESEIITEMAEPPRPAVSEPAVVPVSGPAVQADAGPAVPIVAPAPAPAFVVASGTRSKPPARPAVPEAQARPAAVAPVPTDTPMSVSAPAPSPRPATARAVNPEDVCADSNFFVKPMCIYRECQKAASTHHPVCVENRRRQEEDQRRQMMR